MMKNPDIEEMLPRASKGAVQKMPSLGFTYNIKSAMRTDEVNITPMVEPN